MKEILLTHEKVALVDNEDYERLSKIKWQYDKTSCGVLYGTLRMSHAVLQTNQLIDHKDGDKLNNQKTNLRPCTLTQNSQNRRKIKTKTSSKYKGVHFRRNRGKWCATIWFQNIFGQKIQIWLGSFLVEKEAARAYDKAARQRFGEFAALNFPLEGERSCLNA